jgi:hypothetical protein
LHKLATDHSLKKFRDNGKVGDWAIRTWITRVKVGLFEKRGDISGLEGRRKDTGLKRIIEKVE